LLSVRIGKVDVRPADLQRRLESWNRNRANRPECQMRLLFEEPDRSWAVANKPAGLHTAPYAETYRRDCVTFLDLLPALVRPPRGGTRCRHPQTCHRLDFRVSGPVVVATTTEAERAIRLAFQERRVLKEYRAIVCGTVGAEGETLVVDAPVEGRPARTEVQVLQVVRCPHFGSLSELRLWPQTGRYQQLRRHCAEVLGAPIVNEEEPLFRAAAEAWQHRHGSPLPPPVRRARGNLFLQAVEVGLPAMSGVTEGRVVRGELSDRFPELLQQSQGAWERGWRLNEVGDTHRPGLLATTAGVA